MSNHSDPLFDQYADLDFADAKSVGQVPALARLQAEQGGIDQTPINEALRQFVEGQTLADVVRETIRHELGHG